MQCAVQTLNNQPEASTFLVNQVQDLNQAWLEHRGNDA
jgi:hypothetical protein